MNNLTNIGGIAIAKHGNPIVTNTPYGDAVLFSGLNQGLVFPTNPIAGWTNFTAEMIFRPDPTNTGVTEQPRIFYIQSPSSTDHRLTLEGRITNNLWYADTFLRYSAASNVANIDPTKVHPLNVWHQLAVTYDGTLFKQYVNGTLELTTNVWSGALTNGKSYIGMNATSNRCFQGAVLSLRFTHRVLSTNEFLCIPKLRCTGMEVNENTAQMDFRLAAGLPLDVTLQETDRPDSTWSNSAGAILTTNVAGAAYRFTVPSESRTKYFRVHWP